MPTRQNQYFLPGEGIRREVITADICRYLGNDALVKPGRYEVGTIRVLRARRRLLSRSRRRDMHQYCVG